YAAGPMPSDVIEAHVRRLPPFDPDLWAPRPITREELERALLAGLVAGWATHPLDNVRRNARLLLDHDPDKEFGLTGLQDGRSLDSVLDLVERAAGAPIEREARSGPVEIRPQPIVDPGLAAAGRRPRGVPPAADVRRGARGGGAAPRGRRHERTGRARDRPSRRAGLPVSRA